MRQIRLAFRTLFRTPFVTVIAILSLALGIGANAAIFSMFDQILLRSLPVNEPGQLVNLGAPGEKPGSTSCSQAGSCQDVFSYPMFKDLEKQQKSFTGIAAHVGFGANIAIRQQSLDGAGELVSGSYFPILGIKPAIGRLLMPADDDKIGGNFVAVLSYAFWQARLGGDPKVLNEQISINGKSWTIVGVAPDGFDGTTLGSMPKVYVPLSMRKEIQPWFNAFDNRRSYWAYLFARLKPGVTVEQAKVALNGIYGPIIRDVEGPLQQGMSDQTKAKFLKKEVTVVPGKQGQSFMHENARRPLYILMGVTGIVLLIACANIANLLLARGANRSMEMSVRLALGASRSQLLFQLLTESVLLAALGGLASLAVAKLTLAGLASMLPPEAGQSLKFELQPSMIAFAGALSIGTGLLFGMFPALNSTRPDLVTSIRSNAGQISGARAANRFRTSLVTVQIALSMALLISAGLFIKSLINVSNVDLGLKVDNVVTFSISPERSGYDTDRSQILFKRVEEELRALPGVTGVSSGLVGLLQGSNWGTGVHVQGFEVGPDTDNNANYNEVGPGYFNTLGVRMKAGRDIAASDIKGAAQVAVVNETFVKKYNLGNDAVGKYMSDRGRDSLNIQIVGVIYDARYSDVKDTVPAIFYKPWQQSSRLGTMNFYIKTNLQLSQILMAIPGIIKKLDPALPVEDLKTMPQQIRENIFLDRMISTMSAAFAGLATLLAGIGLYGVLAYTVAQRTREIGVRMALGADSTRVKKMVLKQVGAMVAVGGAVGIGGAIAAGKAAASMLYEMKGNDPVVFVASTVMLVMVALLAGYLPARRAAKVHPMQALRYE